MNASKATIKAMMLNVSSSIFSPPLSAAPLDREGGFSSSSRPLMLFLVSLYLVFVFTFNTICSMIYIDTR